MNRWGLIIALFVIVLAGNGCGATSDLTPTLTEPLSASPSATITTLPATVASIPATERPTSTHTLIPATATLAPTDTPISLNYTPFPPAPTTGPASGSVCARGCDFTTIQAALDDPGTFDGAVIEVSDPVHTEAGIVVNKSVTIRGLGSEATVIQAAQTPEEAPERVFLIEAGASVVLEAMTIRYGRPSNPEECGGGIMNSGALSLRSCVVSDNIANSGGGICNAGALELVNSSVVNNLADGEGPVGYTCGNGGGIKCQRGTLTLVNSTISGNQSMDADPFREVGCGGGVHIGCNCSAVFTNSTISGNSSVACAGGIYNHGDLQLINCTISENRTVGEGGGIYVRGHLDFVNTIIAENMGKGGSCVVGGPGGYRGEGTIGINANNLVSGSNCGDPAFSGDPMLGPLADNGGETLTHALLEGSPAIDAILPSGCPLPSDQRWLPRPVPWSSSDTTCDIGAFEFQGNTPTSSPALEEPAATPARTAGEASKTLFHESFDAAIGDWERPYGTLRHTRTQYMSAPGAALLTTSDYSGSMDYRGSFGRCFDLREILEDWPEIEDQKYMTIEAYLKSDAQIGKATLNAIFIDDPQCGTGLLTSIDPLEISGGTHWTRLFSTVVVPEEAQSLHLFFSASSLSASATLVVDDIWIYTPVTVP